MRIVHVISGLRRGGAELTLQRLIESHSERREWQHSVISLSDLGGVGLALRGQGIPVEALGMRGPGDLPSILLRLTRRFRRDKPDIVQTWMYHADLLGGLAARAAGCNHVIWGIRSTDLNVGTSPVTTTIRKICALLSHTVPSAIVCAADASRLAHEAVGYDPKRMLVIPNGFDPRSLAASAQLRAEARQAFGLRPEHLVVGSLGRFNLAKDQATFIQAAARLPASVPEVRFLMVGRDVDSQNRQLMGLIALTGCPERFVLLGERQDVSACLNAMDVFCLHSRTEGFPNVLGEAMTVGLPCVATDVGDAGYLLGTTGVLVAPGDSGALAAGLERVLLMRGNERAAFGRAAHQRIMEHFSMSHASASFAQVYARLLGREDDVPCAA